MTEPRRSKGEYLGYSWIQYESCWVRVYLQRALVVPYSARAFAHSCTAPVLTVQVYVTEPQNIEAAVHAAIRELVVLELKE